MRLAIVIATVVLMVLPFGHSPRAADLGAPTVVIEPGDITPLRGPNIRNPLGPSAVYAPLPSLQSCSP